MVKPRRISGYDIQIDSIVEEELIPPLQQHASIMNPFCHDFILMVIPMSSKFTDPDDEPFIGCRHHFYYLNSTAPLILTTRESLSLNTLVRVLRLSIKIDQSDQLNSVPVLRNMKLPCVFKPFQ